MQKARIAVLCACVAAGMTGGLIVAAAGLNWEAKPERSSVYVGRQYAEDGMIKHDVGVLNESNKRKHWMGSVAKLPGGDTWYVDGSLEHRLEVPRGSLSASGPMLLAEEVRQAWVAKREREWFNAYANRSVIIMIALALGAGFGLAIGVPIAGGAGFGRAIRENEC